MKEIERTKRTNPSLLIGELAAIPGMAPVPAGAGAPAGFVAASFSLHVDGDDITLTVPDGVTDAQIDAVLAAHDPTRVAVILNQYATEIAALKAATVTTQVAALKTLVLRLAGDTGA